MSKGLLVEIDISELVWDEQTDGSHEYACDRIDEFIDEISDQNKIIPYNFNKRCRIECFFVFLKTLCHVFRRI